jgi:hypothetical protein
VTRNELREGLELLLEKVSGGVVFELASLVIELSRASANEDFRFVEREGIEEDHHAAQVVLHATAAERTRRGRLDRDRLAGKGLENRASSSIVALMQFPMVTLIDCRTRVRFDATLTHTFTLGA